MSLKSAITIICMELCIFSIYIFIMINSTVTMNSVDSYIFIVHISYAIYNTYKIVQC